MTIPPPPYPAPDALRRCAGWTTIVAALGALTLAACSDGDVFPTTRGYPDASVTDAARGDAAVDDAGATDAGDEAGALDAGTQDAGALDAGPADAPARYPADALHSPLSPHVAQELARIAANDPALHGDVFAKVGDSITVSTSFLQCFAGTRVVLDGRTGLSGTLAAFGAGDAAGTTPYQRTTLAAGVGWSASHVLTGAPPLVVQEVDAVAPRFAVVMYGTNDIGANNPVGYADDMANLLDTLTERGVVPVVSSFPPRDDDAAADARIPLYKAILRGLAEARQIPYVDLERVLRALPGHGLGPDNVHPNQAPTGACDFSAAGLGYGYDVRNLVTIEALDRARRALVVGESPPDAESPPRMGDGTSASPYLVDTLPFTDVRNTTYATERLRATYSGCSSTADESGAEYVYRLTLSTPRHIDAWVFDRGTVDVDVHLLDATGAVAGCVARNDSHVSLDLAAGTWTLVLDTYASGGVERAGEYLLVVL